MTDLLQALIAVIVEALATFFTSRAFVKSLLAVFTYVFLFTIIPLLIQFLVPDQIMHAMNSYVQMLQGGGTTLSCSGSAPLADSGINTSVSCDTTVTLIQFGQGVAYILNWFCATDFLAAFLPALAVSFLFKRI